MTAADERAAEQSTLTDVRGKKRHMCCCGGRRTHEWDLRHAPPSIRTEVSQRVGGELRHHELADVMREPARMCCWGLIKVLSDWECGLRRRPYEREDV